MRIRAPPQVRNNGNMEVEEQLQIAIPEHGTSITVQKPMYNRIM
jgi:hypothetical protein